MSETRQVPQIFDTALGKARLLRARASGPATFLLDRVIDDLMERLAATMRPFPRVADMATPVNSLVRALAAATPERALTYFAPVPEEPGTTWQTIVGNLEHIDLPPGSFDLALSALALQAVNDLPGALLQIRRLLAPDGLFLACLMGGQSLQELRSAFAEAEAAISGGASPRVFPFADLRDLGALLQRAGFALPVTDIDSVTVRYDTMFALMADLRAMGATNILQQRSRTFLRRDVLLRAAEIYAEKHADPDGRVRATFEIIWLSGWAPHESQQKPLQPGTAKMRLADALPVKSYHSEK
ncbi:MAG: class I SAM-dependent methyltransferase [Beijerinckiaceae bacterium]|jgi:SAM-dependent methyltransferase|nr:class I SAM-dependent methyltransferase [Beijerinckiaceae bacterium]